MTLIIIFFALAIATVFIGVFFLIKNQAVYNFRMKIIDADYRLLKTLPTYEQMLYCWKWPTAKNYPSISNVII